jgi:multimeric flavodoxin WrbA/putative sterol carrier protein
MLILTAFPRHDGFTRHCTDFFIKGVAQTETPHTVLDLTHANIHPCKGCFHCWCKQPGNCIQNDGMKKLLDPFLAADAIVCATPLYAYDISSYLKIFFERTLPLLTPGVTYTSTGIDRNKKRFPDRGPRDMVAIVTGGLGARSHSDGAVTSLRCYAEGFDMHFHGALVRNESYLLQFTDTKPKTIKTIEAAFEQAGRMFALERKVDPDLIEKVATPLAVNQERFQLYSNIYWEHAQKVYARGGDIEEIKSLTRGDLRILMNEMASSVDPVSTSRVKAVLLFKFPDINSSYSITINNGTASIEFTENDNPNLTITCDSKIWVGVIHRTTDPLKALTGGDIKLKGEKDFFRKMGRFFPPPNL